MTPVRIAISRALLLPICMSALDRVQQNPDPSDAEVREWLEGNPCRCTGYQDIMKAIKAGARAMRGQAHT